jgi:hypothetical protein
MRTANVFVPVMYEILIVNSNHWLGMSGLKPAIGVCLPACPKQGFLARCFRVGSSSAREFVILAYMEYLIRYILTVERT